MIENTNPPGETPAASPGAVDNAPEKVEPKEVATASDAVPGTDQAEETLADSEGEKPKKKGGGFQNRIDRLTREREEARARVVELERQQAAPRTTEKVEGEAEPQPPKESEFSDWVKFEDAKLKFASDHARWAVKQELRAEAVKHAERQEAQKAHETRQQAMRRFEKEATTLAPQYEGLDDAVERFFTDQTMPISRPMAEYIMEVSDRGPELVYALDADLDEAERISKLTPIAAARELARLEAKLPKPESRNVTKAPAPPKTVKATGGPVSRDLATLAETDMAAYSAMRAAERAKRNAL